MSINGLNKREYLLFRLFSFKRNRHLNVMETVTIVEGTHCGEKVLHLSPKKAFQMWAIHYDTYLRRLYSVFCSACNKNSVDWYKYIDFNTFREYVYENSSKYLSPWL